LIQYFYIYFRTLVLTSAFVSDSILLLSFSFVSDLVLLY